MRLLAAVFLRHPFCRSVSFIALVVALGCSSARAQQQVSSPDTLALLARAGCETGARLDGDVNLDTGYLAMLGMSEKAYSFRVMRDGTRTMMIPAVHCNDPRALESRPFILILSHSFQNQHRVREGFYYLMNQRGQLVSAVHFQDGRSHLFAFANPDIPVRRADFEAEKDIWISKVAEMVGSDRNKRGGD